MTAAASGKSALRSAVTDEGRLTLAYDKPFDLTWTPTPGQFAFHNPQKTVTLDGKRVTHKTTRRHGTEATVVAVAGQGRRAGLTRGGPVYLCAGRTPYTVSRGPTVEDFACVLSVSGGIRPGSSRSRRS